VARFPVAAGRRVGWIVERFTDMRLDALAQAVSVATSEPSNLDPHGGRRGGVDARWGVRVNAVVEPDL
jgi:predicted transcriptional regulator of viral defense system